MKSENTGQFEYDCVDVSDLLALYVSCPEELTSDERMQIERHLGTCPACRQEYRELKALSDVLGANRAYLAENTVFDARESLRDVSDEEVLEVRFGAMLERAAARRARRKRKERTPRIRRVFRRISAVAACLAIGIALWGVVSHFGGDSEGRNAGSYVKNNDSLKIEVVSGDIRRFVEAGEQINASAGLKTLRINENRRVVLNVGTELSVEPLTENGNLGCLVKLGKGEIYAQVEHDGRPFVVETAHGRAVITGTTFNVKVEEEQTELIVAEGAVSFGSPKGSVNVVAGQVSYLAENSLPTEPVVCDAGALILWALDQDSGASSVISAEGNPGGEIDIPLPMRRPRLADTDYDTWVSENRDWFKTQFPHIFQLQAALAKEGIAADYPQLLVETGGLWQFVFSQAASNMFTEADAESLLRIAADYGLGGEWLEKNIPAWGSLPRQETKAQDSSGRLDAMESWLKAAEKAEKLPSPLYSYYAATYLANTRSLLWFAVRDGKYELTDEKRAELLELLQAEVDAAGECANSVLYGRYLENSAADDYACMTQNERIREHIKAIIRLEERLTEANLTKNIAREDNGSVMRQK